MAKSSRPYIICHMCPSVDGRIDVKRWSFPKNGIPLYDQTASTLKCDGWIIGRVSMDPYAGKSRVPKRRDSARIPRHDFVSMYGAKSYAIAVDPKGKLTWRSNAIDDDHVITILLETVSDDYLAFLRERGVSYVFAGRSKLDLGLALSKLRKLFGIERLLLEGGGVINGAFLTAGLIDELSVIIAPFADGSLEAPTLFDVVYDKPKARALKLLEVERLKGDFVWLRYKVK